MTLNYPDRTRETDENLWLEDIYGEAQLAWVSAQNERTLATFDAETLAATRASLLEAYDADDRIPLVSKHGDWLFNFWTDAEHPRGLWRRTTLESFTTDTPAWELLIDVGALGKAEETDWVWSGASLCHPDYTRALVELSPDGGDAVVVREFDLDTRSFLSDGFHVPYGKTNVDWIDTDTIFVATDFGQDSLTSSGYAREVRRWTRGTNLSDAQSIIIIDADHMSVAAWHDNAKGFECDIIVEMVDFFTRRYYLLDGDTPVPIEVPGDSQIGLHHGWLTVQPKSAWTVDGTTYQPGSLLAITFAEFMAGSRTFDVVFEQTASTSLASARWTRNHLILNLFQDVASVARIATPGEGGWSTRDLALPPLQNTQIWALDEDDADDFWQLSTGFLQPATLSLGSVDGAETRVVKQSAALFDAADLTVEQHFATSADGTRVPYFQVGHRDLVLDGSHPTLLYGYGGFEYPQLPAYDGGIGRAWLTQGGVYVLANIRGGGEYGPDWHTSAMREQRHLAYDDFSAVAKDLIARGVTSPEHLGCHGRSNGGLLVGNMLTHYPELFSAVVCGVPLLDMQRYVYLNAGASWIAEYGDPRIPEDWEFIQTFSPYHNLREGVDYPPVLFYTATSDDRVGPVQARKMAERMQQRGHENVWFYENQQGGHAGSADNGERATIQSLVMEFLRKHLG